MVVPTSLQLEKHNQKRNIDKFKQTRPHSRSGEMIYPSLEAVAYFIYSPERSPQVGTTRGRHSRTINKSILWTPRVGTS